MANGDIATELRGLSQPRGPEARLFRVGAWRIALHGLDSELAARLDRRWGPFLASADPGASDLAVRVLRVGTERFLPGPVVGQTHRLEAAGAGAVRSHHFALAPDVDAGAWRCALVDQALEPVDRVVENAVRYLTARLAVAAGGLALHGATVLRASRAWIFAGPSRSGKSTAVALSAPSPSLGDDFAAVVPAGGAWQAMPVPFDNQERAPDGAAPGLVELAGIFRLFQSAAPSVESPPRLQALASLLACAAMAPAMPDCADRLVANAERFIATGRFAHLHFRKDPDFWPLLDP